MNQILYRPVRLAVEGRLVGVSLPYGVDSTVRGDGGEPYVERFGPGVFARSLAERGAKVKLFSGQESRAVPIGGAAAVLEESETELLAAFAVPEGRQGDEVLALIEAGAQGVLAFRPVQDRREGDVLVRAEAALVDVRVLNQTPQHVVPRAVAERRLKLLELGASW
ncbi:prophage protease [Mycolicibacterium sp. TY66]|uniref:HK97 family phage prohead protease n=1 Tax=unclassified Mycolicibacterium TaxID=2636767 RepID=UPI001BB2FE05|nr:MULTISPECIES: HK97 family phage prohead protease [unclassified Mycolicibacterium]BCI84401.1 prophage protease [Mycolicibacterium sp. TY66]BCJ83978.1 prophage protease [Mycolicibacterium sp. TY81]